MTAGGERAVLRGAGLPRLAPADARPARPGRHAWFGGFLAPRRPPVPLSSFRQYPLPPESPDESAPLAGVPGDERPGTRAGGSAEPPRPAESRREAPVSSHPAPPSMRAMAPAPAASPERRGGDVSVMRNRSGAAAGPMPAAGSAPAPAVSPVPPPAFPAAGAVAPPPARGLQPPAPEGVAGMTAPIDVPRVNVPGDDGRMDSSSPVPGPSIGSGIDVRVEPGFRGTFETDTPARRIAGLSREDDVRVVDAAGRARGVERESRIDVMGGAPAAPGPAPAPLDAHITTQLTVLRELRQRDAPTPRRIEIRSVHVNVTPPPAAPRDVLPALPPPATGVARPALNYVDPWLSADVVIE